MIEATSEGLIINGVTKRVVKDLTMKIENNVLTCLLGVNGAGKTTTLKMIIGQLNPAKGTVHAFGVNVHKNRFDALSNLGYCAQTDGLLLSNLTVEEHLRLFVSLVTKNASVQDEAIKSVAAALHFTEYLGVRCANLSGGTKRKVSCAIAILSPSKLVVLDEPTTGVDASARSSLWNGLSAAKCSKAFLVTTHYMREASLSDSIAIMNRGGLHCHDSEFELANNYGRGYNVRINCRNEDLGHNIAGWFQSCIASKVSCNDAETLPFFIVSQFSNVVTIRLDSNNVVVSSLMLALEEAKEKAIIESFSVSKLGIEDIFMQLERTS